MKTKYKLSKYKEELAEGEFYYEIRYQYNNGKFRVVLSAKDTAHAREKFNNYTHGDWCQIDDVKKKK